MDWSRQCAAVIPCFNEAAGISDVVTGVRRFLPAVIVVDDGSQDDTSTRAAAAGAEVLSHATNRGKGAALQTGWQRARERGFAWSLTLDGDGQHAAEDAPRLLSRAETTSAALVIGNRLDQPDGMPWVRLWVNRWMTWRLSRAAGIPLADSQCGFRLVKLNLLSRLRLQAQHFEIESEMLLAFVAAGQRVEFVPVRTIYKSHPSKIHPLLDTWRWFRWWWTWRSEHPAVPNGIPEGATKP